ncbi:MAG TPA: hypothetical protein VII05_06335 [Gaiellaceae bacterium]
MPTPARRAIVSMLVAVYPFSARSLPVVSRTALSICALRGLPLRLFTIGAIGVASLRYETVPHRKSAPHT